MLPLVLLIILGFLIILFAFLVEEWYGKLILSVLGAFVFSLGGAFFVEMGRGLPSIPEEVMHLMRQNPQQLHSYNDTTTFAFNNFKKTGGALVIPDVTLNSVDYEDAGKVGVSKEDKITYMFTKLKPGQAQQVIEVVEYFKPGKDPTVTVSGAEIKDSAEVEKIKLMCKLVPYLLERELLQ